MRNAIVDKILMDVEVVATATTDAVMMEITMKNASKMRMRNTSWKYKMVGME